MLIARFRVGSQPEKRTVDVRAKPASKATATAAATAVPHRRNHASCQVLLREAATAGIKIGTDGVELILFKPREMSRESWFSFERAIVARRDEIISIIQGENAARQGVGS
jgi:hypothetical protein